jgi:hypothetical protein
MAATSPELALEMAGLDVRTTRLVRLVGVLRAGTNLEEIPVQSDVIAPSAPATTNPVRAFRVSARGLEREGLQKGDCLLVQLKVDLRPKDLVVVETKGSFSAHRIVGEQTGFVFDPPLSTGVRSRIVGAFVGILRRRLGPRRDNAIARSDCRASTSIMEKPTSFTIGRIRLLRSKLGMLESTYTATRNPRLQRALRNEAERIRIQLQNEPLFD